MNQNTPNMQCFHVFSMQKQVSKTFATASERYLETSPTPAFRSNITIASSFTCGDPEMPEKSRKGV